MVKGLKPNLVSKIAFLFCTVPILLGFIVWITPCKAQGGTITMGIAPSTLTVNQGELFNVTVYINNMPMDEDLAGIQFKVTWDPAVLAGVSMTDVLFSTWTPAGEEDNVWRIKHTVTATQAEYGYLYMDTARAKAGGYLPIYGDLTVAIITLNGTAQAGYSSVRFSQIILGDSTGEPILSWTYPKTVPSGFVLTESLVEVGNPPPLVSIESPENRTHNQIPIDLTFTVSEATSWIGYSLDGQTNVTITGNTTITQSDGTHNIIVYATDTTEQTAASDRIYFTIDTTPPVASFSTSPEEPEATLIFGTWKWKILFNASESQDLATKIISYDWDFGDGSTGKGVAINHTYRDAGTYDVTLTVKDSGDHIDTEVMTIKLHTSAEPISLLLLAGIVLPVVWVTIMVVFYLKTRKK